MLTEKDGICMQWTVNKCGIQVKAIQAFFPLFNVVQPTQIFAFKKKKKKSYAEGNEGNDSHDFKQLSLKSETQESFWPCRFLVFFPCSHLVLTAMSIFLSSNAAMLFVTTLYCFQAPQILCCGTGPPSFWLLFQFSFCFVFSFSDPKSENALDNKRKKKEGEGLEKEAMPGNPGSEAQLYQHCTERLQEEFIIITTRPNEKHGPITTDWYATA